MTNDNNGEMSDETVLPEHYFDREDTSPDEEFYVSPRFETHIDDATIENLTQFYSEIFTPSHRLLDLMSSWISHYPTQTKYQHVSGLGMNKEELIGNPQLDEHVVQNLNTSPLLPWPIDSFDAVTIAVSVQYLIRPFEVFDEIGRILAPGGKCIVAMSHRLFPTKVVRAFYALSPNERCQLVSLYMRQTGMFKEIEIIDRSPPLADPLWLVVGTTKS